MKNRTRVAVLGMLHAEPLSGYDLKKAFDERVRHFWAESPGQIYPTLRKLEEERLVRSQSGVRNGRARTVYSITPAGRRAFAEWMAEPPSPPVVRNEMLLKMFFGATVSPDLLIAHLDRAEAALLEGQVQYEGFIRQIEQLAGSKEQEVLWKLTLSSGQRIGEARLDWCRESKRALRDLAKRRAR